MRITPSATELVDITNDIRDDPRKAAVKMARLQRQAIKAYEERDELLVHLSRLYESHLMPITQARRGQDWRYALCIHMPAGLVIYKLDNVTAVKFSHLPHIDEDHYTAADDTKARTERLLSPSL